MAPRPPSGRRTPRSPDELLALARRRGTQLRRRRRGAVGALVVCAASGLAAAVVLVVPRSSPQRLQVVGSPNQQSGTCPASPFSFSPVQPPPDAAFTPGPGLRDQEYAHLEVGQSTVLYEGNGASIILSRGVSTGAFAVGADERRLLVSLQLLGTTTYFYPPGSGLAEPRIPFRYPTASAPQEPCNRYELIGGGAYQNFGGNASEPILIATAERFHPTQPASGAPTTTTELVAPPSTTSTTTAVGPASDPVASPFDQCPSPPPLSFDANASQNAIATVRAAVPRIYTNINTAGYQITSAEPAGASGFGSIPAGMCGALVGERTYVVELSFPAMAPSASLSQGQLFVSRFPQGWQVWERYH